MHPLRLARLGVFALGLGVLTGMRAAAGSTEVVEREHNLWPFYVAQEARGAAPGAADNGTADRPSWTAAGPLVFGNLANHAGTTAGIRPFWVKQEDAHGNFRAGYVLYPLFTYRDDGNTYHWTLLNLIRSTGAENAAPQNVSQFEKGHRFEIWPFWFSRTSPDPELNYRALFPIAGTVRHKLGMDRATWALFPLYFQSEKKGVVSTRVPWPIVRFTSGEAHGFGIWPLFEMRERPGKWRQETYLWPFGYNNTKYPAPDAAPGTPPDRHIGALPFYARHTGPGLRDESFLWPFFGYTDRTSPKRYHETRYFWPFLVQGRGDERYVNRWGPFYTHSIKKGYDKKWYAWPVVKRAEWNDRGLALSRTQVLYFLYWSEHQRDAVNLNKAGATLTHLWPLYSRWDNGAGQRQFQLFSPFEVFFPGNTKIRAAWSPLVAIARYDQSRPGESRVGLLWNAVTWRRNEAAREREFHLGPLFSVVRHGEARRIAIGNGLLSLQRHAHQGWRLGWFDFPSRRAGVKTPAAAPDSPAPASALPAPTR